MTDTEPPQYSTLNTSLVPGSVWWCDGIALSFEAKFKRRPVLVVEVQPAEEGADNEDQVVVVPLSSSRRYGQEPEVRHEGGVSYMAGEAVMVPRSALLKSLGTWNGTTSSKVGESETYAVKSSLIAKLRVWFTRRTH